MAVYPLVHEKLSYDAARDIVPVGAITNTFGAIAVPASLPDRDFEGICRICARPARQLNWATGGGAFPVLISGLLKAAGLDMTQVPYRNQNLALQDLAEARIQIFATAMTVLSPLTQAGKIRVLAVTNKASSALWPDIVTIAEAGYPDFTFDGLIGVFAPGGMPGRHAASASRLKSARLLPIKRIAAASRLGSDRAPKHTRRIRRRHTGTAIQAHRHPSDRRQTEPLTGIEGTCDVL